MPERNVKEYNNGKIRALREEKKTEERRIRIGGWWGRDGGGRRVEGRRVGRRRRGQIYSVTGVMGLASMVKYTDILLGSAFRHTAFALTFIKDKHFLTDLYYQNMIYISIKNLLNSIQQHTYSTFNFPICSHEKTYLFPDSSPKHNSNIKVRPKRWSHKMGAGIVPITIPSGRRIKPLSATELSLRQGRRPAAIKRLTAIVTTFMETPSQR